MDIEQRLKAALRPEDPGPDFTSAVLQRVARGEAAAPRRVHHWQWPAALAASVVFAVVGFSMVQELREQHRQQVAQQLAVALEITSAQLNAVQQRLTRNEQTPKENGI